MTDQLLGVVEIDGAGKGWLAPVDKRVRNSSPIADLGGAERGQLVLAEPAGRSPRSGVRVTEVLGDPLAPRAFSLIAIMIQFSYPFLIAQGAQTDMGMLAFPIFIVVMAVIQWQLSRNWQRKGWLA